MEIIICLFTLHLLHKGETMTELKLDQDNVDDEFVNNVSIAVPCCAKVQVADQTCFMYVYGIKPEVFKKENDGN